VARSLWTLIGQVLSSASNFVLSLIILASASSAEFAVFSVGLTAYLLVTQLNRTAFSLAGLMLYSDQPDPARLWAAPAAATVLTGALGSCALALTSLAFATDRPQLLVLAAFLPLLEYQDAVRHVAFASARPKVAAQCDAMWLVLQLVGSLFAAAMGHRSPTVLLLVWAAAGSLSGLVFGARLGVVPRLTSCWTWMREQGTLCRRLFTEFVLTSGGYYVLSYGLALLAGAGQLGRLRAAQSLIGPVSVLLLGGNALGVPESVRVRHERDRLRRFALALSAFLGLTALAGGLAVYAVIPTIGPHVFPSTWATARPVLPLMTVFAAGVGVSTGPTSAIRAWGPVGWIVRTRAVTSLLALAVGLPACAALGAEGALAGLALSEWLFASAAWVNFWRSAPLSAALEVHAPDRGRPPAVRGRVRPPA
jgi:O-antigen/teichoic acid export membrane protein